MPLPPASTAEAVDPSAGAAILEDPGPAAGAAGAAGAAWTRAGFLPDSRCLLIFIYRRLCSGYNINTSILEVVALHLVSFSPCLLCLPHAAIFDIFISDFIKSSALAFLLFGHISQVFCVCVLVVTWVLILPLCTRYCFCCCSLHISVCPVLFCGNGWM